jgi:Domain of Unknown Function (DUF1080)
VSIRKVLFIGSTAAFAVAISLTMHTGTVRAGSQGGGNAGVLASDNFSNPSAGLFPPTSPVPNTWQVGYINGEYQIAGLDPNAIDGTSVTTDATFGNMKVAVDARVDGDTTNTEVGVVCRWAAGNSPGGYELDIFPGSGAISVTKLRAGERSNFLLLDQNPAVNPGGQSNHLELTCSGRTITASVNGTVVGSTEDPTFSKGSAGLSIARAANPGTVSARFSNFVVTQP